MITYIVSIHWIIDGTDKGTISKSIKGTEGEYYSKLKKACHSRLLLLANPKNALEDNEHLVIEDKVEGTDKHYCSYIDVKSEKTTDGKNQYTITVAEDGAGFDDLVDFNDLKRTSEGTCYKSRKSWYEAGLEEVIYVPEVELFDYNCLEGHVLFAGDVIGIVGDTNKKEMIDTAKQIFSEVKSDLKLCEIAKNIYDSLEWSCYETECNELAESDFDLYD